MGDDCDSDSADNLPWSAMTQADGWTSYEGKEAKTKGEGEGEGKDSNGEDEDKVRYWVWKGVLGMTQNLSTRKDLAKQWKRSDRLHCSDCAVRYRKGRIFTRLGRSPPPPQPPSPRACTTNANANANARARADADADASSLFPFHESLICLPIPHLADRVLSRRLARGGRVTGTVLEGLTPSEEEDVKKSTLYTRIRSGERLRRKKKVLPPSHREHLQKTCDLTMALARAEVEVEAEGEAEVGGEIDVEKEKNETSKDAERVVETKM